MTLSDQPLPFDVPFDPSPRDPGSAVMLVCTKCSASTYLSEAGARSKGWRIFSGTTQGGEQLEDILCGSCSGRGELVPSWNWRCKYCLTTFADFRRPEDPPLATLSDAIANAAKHRCEPFVEYRAPGTIRWMQDYEQGWIEALSRD